MDDIIQDIKNALGGDLPQWATETTLADIKKILEGSGDGLKSIKNANDTIGEKFKSGTFIGGLYQAQLETDKLSKKTAVVTGVLGEIASISGVAVKSIFNSSGKFSDLNPVIEATTGAAANLASQFGPLGVAVGAVIQVFGKLRQAQNEILDNQVQGFMKLSKSGLNLTTDIMDLNVAAERARLNLDVLADVVTANAAGITALGGEFTRGANRFLQLQTDIQTREGNMLERMGFNVEEQAMFIGEFIENNQRNATLTNMTQKQLADTVFGVTKNFRILTELTGADIEAQRQAQAEVAGDMAFQARIRELVLMGREDEAQALLQTVSTLNAINPNLANVVKQSASSIGMAFDANSAVLANTMGGQASINNILDGIQNIDDVPTVVAQLLQSANTAASDMGNLQMAQLGLGGITNEYIQSLQDMVQIGGRFDTFLKAAEDNDMTVAEYIASIAADTEEGSEKQAEGSQKLLEAAIELDKSAKALTAAILENFDDLFNEQIASNKNLAEDIGVLSSANTNFIEKFNAVLGVAGEGLGIKSIDRQLGRLVDGLTGGRTNFSDEGFLSTPLGDAFSPSQTAATVGNFMGGPLGANMLSMVGEDGPELIKSGSQGSEVINNATTEKIMGAANAVVNNIGNDGTDVLKQISDILNQSNTIQSNILKETRRSKGFQY